MLNIERALDAKRAGDQLGLSPVTVHYLRRRGKLNGIKVADRVWLFAADEVARLAAEREGRRLARAS